MSKFNQLKNNIAKQYENAGMSKKKAEDIGGGVAYNQGVKKLGKKKFLAKALRARKASK